MNRTDLLTEIYAGRTRLEAALTRLPVEQMIEPDLPGGWSVKDLLAHLGWWEQRAVEIYQVLARGESPDTPVSGEGVDEVNARILEQFRARDLEDIRAFERSAYEALLNLVETAPEADLFDAQRFVWSNGMPFREWIIGNSSGHYDEHLDALQGKLAEDQAALRPPAIGEGKPSPVGDAGQLNPVVERARQFLQREGRDIDQAMVEVRFGVLPVASALEVLGRYQNADGGFGRLEFDIQAPQSNPFATELALNLLIWLDPPRDHPLVRGVLAYLESTQDAEGTWRFTPEIYQAEMAPWFKNWQWPNLNPSCTTAGLLKQLGVGSTPLHARVHELFERLAAPADLNGNDFYLARSYAYYLQTEWDFPLADFYRWGVVWWLVRQHTTNPNLDAAHFMEYAPQPTSAVAKRLPPDVLQTKLNQLLADQMEDGGWPTPYDQNWRKWITVQNLLILRAYGKI